MRICLQGEEKSEKCFVVESVRELGRLESGDVVDVLGVALWLLDFLFFISDGCLDVNLIPFYPAVSHLQKSQVLEQQCSQQMDIWNQGERLFKLTLIGEVQKYLLNDDLVLQASFLQVCQLGRIQVRLSYEVLNRLIELIGHFGVVFHCLNCVLCVLELISVAFLSF